MRQEIIDRLTDKADDPYVLLDHLSDVRLNDLARYAFLMTEHPYDSEKFQYADDRIKSIRSDALQEYITANYEDELAEFKQELADAEVDAQIDARKL